MKRNARRKKKRERATTQSICTKKVLKTDLNTTRRTWGVFIKKHTKDETSYAQSTKPYVPFGH